MAAYFANELSGDGFADRVVQAASGRLLDWQRNEATSFWRRFQELLRGRRDGEKGGASDATL
jgi:hypothetical protein